MISQSAVRDLYGTPNESNVSIPVRGSGKSKPIPLFATAKEVLFQSP